MITVDRDWLSRALQEKVVSVDWDDAKEDVHRFLNAAEQESLKLWCERFFFNKVQILNQII